METCSGEVEADGIVCKCVRGKRDSSGGSATNGNLFAAANEAKLVRECDSLVDSRLASR